MSFFNETNRKRVAKIMETLELISKSGNTNNADREDFQKLLDPLIQAMAELSPMVGNPAEAVTQEEDATPQPVARRQNPDSTERPGMVIKRAAEEASLQDLTYAMAVYLNRIDEHLKPVPHSKEDK